MNARVLGCGLFVLAVLVVLAVSIHKFASVFGFVG